ncbi:hypothetical protein EJ04DRAFT_556889 [Polyplosphaeria fusca]|uniref:Nuclear condensin complex subunit 3 C-terminal domain-containing protein n=1 Tax=Polyplosphaeria fusca TaxID=682080 RepID=A0A9P4QJ37_9PLEO|nr:hypothetical protein EJ04DRAFT_556889 [Polyplosphaeria fusca]
MPGRPSGRSARSSAATVNRKSSTQTLKSRASSTRTSAYAVEVPDEGPDTSLRTQICQIFGDAQKTTATQRKLVVSLRKIQEACAYEPQNPKKKATHDDFDEGDFNNEVARCVLRVLGVKKSEPVGDRIIRFLGVFLKHAIEKDNAIWQPEGEEATAFPETPSSRLTTNILSNVLQFLTAKDKVVRFRSAQTVAHIVNNLDQIDDEIFDLIRLGLLKRLRDKEPSVRVQAVLGLGRLAENDDEENEDEDSDDDVAGGILAKLLDIMQNDPSADVRRAVLMNLPFRPTTLPYLLERARDLDPGTRRALYGKLLPALGDFRHMRLAEREKLLRWGLRDRDENVRKATARLFRERWIEDCAATHDDRPEEERKPGEVAPPNMDALLELLERVQIVNSGQDGGMAHEAMRDFWDGRPDYCEFINFDDDFWNDLTAESAFVVRTFNDFYNNADANKQGMLEDKMPEVKKLCYFIQKHLNSLAENIRKTALLEEQDGELEEELYGQEFAVEQLLHIALTLDYTDEYGRRQMFNLMKDAIGRPELPEECTKLAVEVLRAVCGSREAGEREFCSIISEAIAEVRDTIGEEGSDGDNADESFHSAQSEVSDSTVDDKPKGKKKSQEEELDPEAAEEKRVREVMVYLKCLHIAQCMLQNVHCDLDSNATLKTMLDTLVVPAARSHEALIRERGFVCLGLMALLSKDLASNNMQLFLHCYLQGQDHPALQQIVIQILSDVLIAHPMLLAPPTDETSTSASDPEPINPLVKPLVKVLDKAFRSSDPASALTACTSASKLMLLSILPQPATKDLLKAFACAYFNPDTSSNPSLRQALSYFLPVFCHSKLSNATLMSDTALPIIQKLMALRDDIDEDDAADEMVGWPVVAGHLAEWTDGRRVVGMLEMGLDGKMEARPQAEEPHVLLAIEVLERVLAHGCSKDERKPLLALLAKLAISSTGSKMVGKGEVGGVDEEVLATLHWLAAEAVEAKVATDATSRNALAKLELALSKRVGDVELVTQVVVEAEAVEAPAAEEEVQQEEEIEEETMLPQAEAEGTRMPLGGSSDEGEEGESEGTVVGEGGGGMRVAVTESDIVDSLLESEI